MDENQEGASQSDKENDIEAQLGKGFFSPYFKVDSLERSFFHHCFHQFGEKSALVYIRVGSALFVFFILYGYFKYDSLVPTYFMGMNLVNMLIATTWRRYRPLQVRYLVLYVQCGVWLGTGCIAAKFLSFENVYIFMASFYQCIDHSTMMVNIVSVFAVIARGLAEYINDTEYVWIISVTLFISFAWSWIVYYEANLIARRVFLIARKKDQVKAGLIARKNLRTMFDLVEVRSTGKFEVVGKDLLTNETVVYEDGHISPRSATPGDDSFSNSSGTESSTMFESEELLRQDQDSWLIDARNTLKRIGSLAILIHLALSLMNWAIIPTELESLRNYLFIYHTYVEVPLFVLILLVINFTKFINTYKKYLRFLTLLIALSVLTSWFEIILINSYETDGMMTKNMISRLFLIFYIRLNFAFQSRMCRYYTGLVDLIIFVSMMKFGIQWIQHYTVQQALFIALLAYATDMCNIGIWDSALRARQYLRRVDELIAEIKSEEAAGNKLFEQYKLEDEDSVTGNEKSLKPVKSPERWTLTNLPERREGQADVFIEIIEELDLLVDLGVEKEELRRIALLILLKYHDNPYHNSMHALAVCHTLKYFLVDGGAAKYLTKQDQLFLVLSGLAHDAGHPGKNNAFLIQTASSLVRQFGTISVLERYHVHNFMNIIGNMDTLGVEREKEVEFLTRFIRSSILSTDTATYKHTIEKFTQFMERLYDISEEMSREKILLCEMMLICADVANVAYLTSQSEMWLVRLLNEFYLQGDIEKSLGLDISMFMDRKRNAPYTLYCGFVDAVAGKMIRKLAEFLDIEDFIMQMENNRSIFGAKKTREIQRVPNLIR